MKVIRTDAELSCPQIDRRLRDAGADLVLLPDATDEDRLAAEARDADLILMCYAPITERVMAGATRLKGIVKYGVGIDAIDLDAARALAIPVVNVPAYAERTVAEGAFAMLIALARRMPGIGRAMAAGGWIWPQPQWQGSDLAGKTLGLVGCGRIGRSMARICGAGFQMTVLGHDPHAASGDLADAGITRCDDLGIMLADCDFVSIHAALDSRNRTLIGPAELARMKRSAILINTARGALVDEAALVSALVAGRLGGAGLDVYGSEPLTRTGHVLSPLFDLDNVILLPHLTFYTAEAMARLEAETLDRCFELLADKPVLVTSRDPRLRAQTRGVRFG